MRESATILVVEDDRAMLDGIYELLLAADIGYALQVVTAADGQIGLESMADQCPDLIISDIMMPRMDGYQFLREVRRKSEWIQIPFIFLTARGEKKDVLEGHLSGADLYIVKPFDSNDLLELVEAQLSKAFSLRQVRRQNAERLKKEILRTLNHEFRTPLTYVTAYYEMLADGVNQLSDGQDLRGYLHGIQSGCVRLTRLVEDLIQVIELRTGETRATVAEKAEPISDIPGLIAEAIRPYEASASKQGIRIVHDVGEDLPAIVGHRQLLRSALGRLLDNAIKFSGTHKTLAAEITVSAGTGDNALFISIEDQGIGFPEEMRFRIFDLFYQHNRSVLEQQGAGLGLTIVKGLIELHGGWINVESQEGRGSRFTINLPSGQGAHGQAVDRGGPRPATVLIVEDDPHLLEGLRELLEISTEQYLYHILAAKNGDEALKVLADRQPDLIISDIMMPGMGGFEFLQQVKQNPDWLQIPFIFLTAKGERHDIHSGLRSGVEQYITKPYDSDDLLDLIGAQLERHFRVQGILSQDFDALKRSILDLITPDFRLPLTSVARYSQMMEQGLEQATNEEELKGSLQGIQASTVRLSGLVEEFIALAELRTGEAVAGHELSSFVIRDIGVQFSQLRHWLAERPETREFKSEWSIDPDLPPVFGNPISILDSVKRLVESGIGNLPLKTASVLSFTAAQAEGEIHLAIRFPQPFDQATEQLFRIALSGEEDFTDAASQPLSLMVANGYVGLHRGRVLLNNEEAGAVFTIVLPAYRPPSAA